MRSIPSVASCSARAVIAFVVAGTSQTLVSRLAGSDGCGTRVHTFPDALATSIAATRATICSLSSTSISSASPII